MKALKCPACGAAVKNEVDGCRYCGVKFKVEKQSNSQSHSQPQQQTINSQIKIPIRPQINVLLLIVLFAIAWPFALIYLVSVAGRQKEWDNKYKK